MPDDYLRVVADRSLVALAKFSILQTASIGLRML